MTPKEVRICRTGKYGRLETINSRRHIDSTDFPVGTRRKNELIILVHFIDQKGLYQMDKSTMPKVISASTARTQFAQMMRRAKEKRDRFVVRRRGEPQVVIIGVKDFIDTIAPEPGFLRLIGEEAKRKGKNKLTMRQIEAEIQATR